MNLILSPGDFNGDNRTDVLARDTAGNLFLYPGNGTGGWGTTSQVGWGWDVMTAVFSTGDFNGDDRTDVLARDSGGTLYLYPGNGTGGWGTRTTVSTGWNTMNSLS
jgi:hypothetical protein